MKCETTLFHCQWVFSHHGSLENRLKKRLNIKKRKTKNDYACKPKLENESESRPNSSACSIPRLWLRLELIGSLCR